MSAELTLGKFKLVIWSCHRLAIVMHLIRGLPSPSLLAGMQGKVGAALPTFSIFASLVNNSKNLLDKYTNIVNLYMYK